MAFNSLVPPPQGPLIPGSSLNQDVLGIGVLNSPWPHSEIEVKENQIINFDNDSFNYFNILVSEDGTQPNLFMKNIPIGFSCTILINKANPLARLKIRLDNFPDFGPLDEGTYFISLFSTGFKYIQTQN